MDNIQKFDGFAKTFHKQIGELTAQLCKMTDIIEQLGTLFDIGWITETNKINLLITENEMSRLWCLDDSCRYDSADSVDEKMEILNHSLELFEALNLSLACYNGTLKDVISYVSDQQMNNDKKGE
jgi:hypothetical protein